MPSRKRNQGKQRKAKAASSAATTTTPSASSEALLQLSVQDDKLAQLVNNLSLKKCDHGRPTLADGDACKLFMMEFERALVLTNDDKITSLFSCASKAIESAADNSLILSNSNDMEQARACLLALGADFLLEAVAKISKGPLKQACAIAMSVVLCDAHKDACQKLAVDPGDLMVDPTTLQKIGDLVGGGLRETISFFAKRLDCSCLKEMYNEVKGDKKTAGCLHCSQFKERKTLMVCSGCKIAQYCCAKCQKDDWPRHKNYCRNCYAWSSSRASARILMFRGLLMMCS